MHHQSTAPLRRPARRGPPVLALSFAVVLIGTGIGVTAYAIMQPLTSPSEPSVIVAESIVTVAAPTPTLGRPTPVIDPFAIGRFGSFNAETMIWVDEVGLWAFNRAVANVDYRRGMDALKLWQHFDIAPGLGLRITNRRRDIFQVEVVGGVLDGRRGWTDATFRWTIQP